MKKWNEKLWLLTPTEFDELDDGTLLECIDGTRVVKGADYIDRDIRFGCMAYGFTHELIEEQQLQKEFEILILKS